MKRKTILLPIALIAILLLLVGLNAPTDELPSARLDIQPVELDGFARADGPAELVFPRDFGPHPDYLTEWWYYTGNLDAPDGRHFGYQLTFFRRALVPPQAAGDDRGSAWAADQLYLAHFTLTDVSSGSFMFDERYQRAAAGLSGAGSDPYRVWLENWSVESVAPGRYRLATEQAGVRLDLTLNDLKGPILQGQNGYSPKGPQPGNASYYFSQTRLATTGTLTIENERIPLSGLSWMDHEYSTSALGPDQVGWDWFSIQLDNDVELMLFHLRKENGEVDRFSSGAIIYPDGTSRSLGPDEFDIRTLDTWTSSHSKAVYPSGWQIQVPSENLTLELAPYLADQELRVFFTYWEGAVSIEGSMEGKAVSGSGYVELTGYAHSMQGEF